MSIKQTQRGFSFTEFQDANGVKCSLQISSAVQDERLLWFGADSIGLKTFVPFTEGWKDMPEYELAAKLGVKDVLANTRMHLTQSQVKELLPLLTRFAET